MGKLIKRFQTTAQRIAYETGSDYKRPYLANVATETVQYGGKSNVTHYNQRYIEFEDPEVERICVTTWGDGEKISYTQASVVTKLNDTFKGNTLITSFDELEYFTGLTNLMGSSTNSGSFQGCTALTKITIPENVTTVNNYVFNGCSSLTTLTIKGGNKSLSFQNQSLTNTKINRINLDSLERWFGITQGANNGNFSTSHRLYINNKEITEIDWPESRTSIPNYMFYYCIGLTKVTIPDTVTSIGNYAFAYCSNLNNFQNNTSASFGTKCLYFCRNLQNIHITTPNIQFEQLAGTGISTDPGELYINGSFNRAGNWENAYFKKLYVTGNTVGFGTYLYSLVEIRINGDITGSTTMGLSYSSSRTWKFLEVLGDVTSQTILFYSESNVIFHLAKTTKVSGDPSKWNLKCVSKIYVGDGSSQAADQAVLDQYLADDAWSAYSDKLDLWYNYTGEYKTN